MWPEDVGNHVTSIPCGMYMWETMRHPSGLFMWVTMRHSCGLQMCVTIRHPCCLSKMMFRFCFRIWDVENGKEKAKLVGHSDYVRSVALSRDVKAIVSGSEDKTIR